MNKSGYVPVSREDMERWGGLDGSRKQIIQMAPQKILALGSARVDPVRPGLGIGIFGYRYFEGCERTKEDCDIAFAWNGPPALEPGWIPPQVQSGNYLFRPEQLQKEKLCFLGVRKT